jgi:aryl-alcohol dehydrogenase (NADP+)
MIYLGHCLHCGRSFLFLMEVFVVRIGQSGLDIFPIQLGGNVFGWTADEAESFRILDAFVAGGGNSVDSADTYSSWVPGNSGGDSEKILGNWMASRKNRDKVIIATKVGMWSERPGSSRANILAAVDDSLARLQTDYIDLYYIHRDDPETPLEETVTALDELVKVGKVRAVGASNFSAERLSQALDIAEKAGSARFEAVQPPYSLVNRSAYEGALEQVVKDRGLNTLTYSSLGSGFLTGKYRGDGEIVASPRAGGASKYLDDRGRAVLRSLDSIAAAHDTSVPTVALAWIRQRPGIAAPISSASSADQVGPLLDSATLQLSSDEIDALNTASA